MLFCFSLTHHSKEIGVKQCRELLQNSNLKKRPNSWKNSVCLMFSQQFMPLNAWERLWMVLQRDSWSWTPWKKTWMRALQMIWSKSQGPHFLIMQPLDTIKWTLIYIRFKSLILATGWRINWMMSIFGWIDPWIAVATYNARLQLKDLLRSS